MTPTIVISNFAYEYQKYTEFYADFYSMEIIWKKCTHKKLFAKNYCTLIVQKRPNSILHTILPIIFSLANFSHFSQQFEISVKFLVVWIPIFKFCEEKVFLSF